MRYTGTHALSIDEKRRTQVPSKWRPASVEVELAVILVEQHEAGPCLRVMEVKDLEALHARLKAMPSDDPLKDVKMRRLGSNTEYVTLDKVGRMTLPTRLAERAGLKDSVLMVGLFEQFEVWNPESFARGEKLDAEKVMGVMPSLT